MPVLAYCLILRSDTGIPPVSDSPRGERHGSDKHNTEHSIKVITRTAVSLLKIYADHRDNTRLYRESMLALLSEDRSIADE